MALPMRQWAEIKKKDEKMSRVPFLLLQHFDEINNGRFINFLIYQTNTPTPGRPIHISFIYVQHNLVTCDATAVAAAAVVSPSAWHPPREDLTPPRTSRMVAPLSPTQITYIASIAL